MLTLDDLDDWLADLAAVDGVKSAVLDPAQLVTPGVWCQVPSFGADVLDADGWRVDLVLHLAVGDQSWRTARDKLLSLFTAVHAHLGEPRIDVVEFITLVLPDGQQVPAIRLPYTLRIVPNP